MLKSFLYFYLASFLIFIFCIFKLHTKKTNPQIKNQNYEIIDQYFCERLAETINDNRVIKTNVSINILKRVNLSFEFFNIGKQNIDFVSEYIQHHGGWEMNHIDTIFTQLENFKLKNNLKSEDVTFIDIGSNIGWVSVIFARLGFNVYSFEPTV